ncbi:MAG: bifunctional diaminohydroxyphosphoribosylaminopyrimidine deaminase/5-amino-6-(5-phosphoribosylamino)uracil reductase RibD [Patescibacteria group bacterium]|nr:bifunctional diaminohydroxyphosphoribosylaminopyrimidine deaminase/5-amino-6-(5-phosphoribosylamino)uracil reductase RibD [Patescibacteria group bacterium]
MSSDEYFIKKTFALAKKGLSFTNPNPLVGSVIVKNGKIIAKGYHRKIGLPHAEIEAVNALKGSAKGATLYTNLEPCVHCDKKTPPCTEGIIKAGITKVVCASFDPNPKVNGKGFERLRSVGIEVVTGVLEEEGEKLNEAFFTFQTKNRPFIALKFAQSLDGKIATNTGDSKWITNEKARDFARRLRLYYQAILVGINTVLRDDPNLGVRVKGKKDPLRIVLDSELKIPLTARVLRDRNVLIATTKKADNSKLRALKDKGIQVVVFNGSRVPLNELIAELTRREIISVLVEGGGEVSGSFFDAGLFYRGCLSKDLLYQLLNPAKYQPPLYRSGHPRETLKLHLPQPYHSLYPAKHML